MVRIFFLLSFFVFSGSLFAQAPRFALVIGNGDYEYASLGQTPANDAGAVRDALTLAGFSVDYYTNLDQSKLSTVITAFGRKIKDSGGVALFYYSGHGVQHNNTNYLVPIGAEMTDEEDIEGLCVPIGRITSRMLNAGTATNIVVLDACRAFPISRGTKSLTQGLVNENYAVPELLVAYATAPGSTATVRGENGLSLYTSQLLKHLKTPGLVLENVLKNTRRDVIFKSNGQQRPDETGNLTSDFYFFKVGQPPITVWGKSSQENPPQRNNHSNESLDSDLDGTPNATDPCPNDYGTLAANGCPDYDEDGVPNSVDKCPNLAGKKSWQGCPDTDEDGVPDHEDRCLFEPGVFADHGCLPPNADRDGDGIVNSKDKCPSVKGILKNGCPQVPFVKSHTVQPGETLQSLSKTYNLVVPEIAQANSLRNDELLEPGIKLFIPVTELDLDSDNDGTPDWKDFCPNEKGTVANKGCLDIPSGMTLVRGGTFKMGRTGKPNEQPVHSVTVSDFYMGKYEVTNAEFVKFLHAKGNQTEDGKAWIDLDGKWRDEKCRIYKSGSTYKVKGGYENHPVIFVNWYGATAYCQWLGSQYRLPTEAEWEYAAGNGSRHTKYSWGNDDPSGKKGGNISDKTAKAKFPSWPIFENYSDGYVYTAPVGQFEANDFGLYDMTGNVWEWCSDWYDADYYQNSPAKDPEGPTTAGGFRILRGGSWNMDPWNCQVASRYWDNPYVRFNYLGFRVVRGY